MPTLAQLKKRQQKLAGQLAKKQGQADKIKAEIEQYKKAIVKLEAKLSGIVGKSPAKRKQAGKKTRKQQTSPSQKEMVYDILASGDEPLSIDEIATRMTAKGYKFQTANPKKGLGVLLYGNKKLFKKVKPGMFTAMKKGNAEQG